MLRNFLTKTFFRFMMILALLLFIGVFVFALDLEKYNVPPEGMVAEFGSKGAKPILRDATTPEVSPLAAQNLSSREIAQRLTEIVAESLSFDKSNYVYNSGKMEQYFTPEGFKQYRQFLDSAGFQATLTDQDLQSGVFLEQSPLELTSGVYGGVYKWVFEVPITISFIPRESETYRDGMTRPYNRRFILRVQFARVQENNNPEAVRIEIWQILPPRKV